MRKKEPTLDVLDDLILDGEQFEPVREPVALNTRKIRSKRAVMKELTDTMLHIEDENGDSRLEKIIDAVITNAEMGDYKAVEILCKIMKAFDDKQKVDVNIPNIKIVVDSDAEGIRYTEKG